MDDTEQDHRLKQLLAQAKDLAVHYYHLTGKPLGVTGEVAEFEAAQKLGLRRSAALLPHRGAARCLELLQGLSHESPHRRRHRCAPYPRGPIKPVTDFS